MVLNLSGPIARLHQAHRIMAAAVVLRNAGGPRKAQAAEAFELMRNGSTLRKVAYARESQAILSRDCASFWGNYRRLSKRVVAENLMKLLPEHLVLAKDAWLRWENSCSELALRAAEEGDAMRSTDVYMERDCDDVPHRRRNGWSGWNSAVAVHAVLIVLLGGAEWKQRRSVAI